VGHGQQTGRRRSEETRQEEDCDEKEWPQVGSEEDILSSLTKEYAMRMLILVLLLLLILGALPTLPKSTGWGYYPSGLGLVILIVLAVLLLRKA